MQFADRVTAVVSQQVTFLALQLALVGGSVVGISEQWPMPNGIKISDYVFVFIRRLVVPAFNPKKISICMHGLLQEAVHIIIPERYVNWYSTSLVSY